jgi:hypothetical protein
MPVTVPLLVILSAIINSLYQQHILNQLFYHSHIGLIQMENHNLDLNLRLQYIPKFRIFFSWIKNRPHTDSFC